MPKVVGLKVKVENILNIEQLEVLYLVRLELMKAKENNMIIPDIVFELIDKVEKEYTQNGNELKEEGY